MFATNAITVSNIMGQIRKAFEAIYKDKKELASISQQAIADILGCKQPSISHYLSGRSVMSDEVIERLCDALGVKLSDLENWNRELARIRFAPSKDTGAAIYACANKAHAKYHRMLDTILDGKIKEWKTGIIANLKGMSFSASADSAGKFPKGDNIRFIAEPPVMPMDPIGFEPEKVREKRPKTGRKKPLATA
jgi:transcriptional regulator with XRE-family HTH domain